MDYRLELVPIPVSDVDRAKAFYAEKARFNVGLDVSTLTPTTGSATRGASFS